MLSTVSWSNYGVTVLVLVLIWYGFVLFKFYPSVLKGIFKKRGMSDGSSTTSKVGHNTDDLFAEFREPFDTLEDAKELYHKLLEAITESNERNLSKVEFTNYIRYILESYPYVKISSLRDKINSLVVVEFEKYPMLSLGYHEMDSLWEQS